MVALPTTLARQVESNREAATNGDTWLSVIKASRGPITSAGGSELDEVRTPNEPGSTRPVRTKF